MEDLFHKILIHLHSINALYQYTDITDFLKQTLGQDYNNPGLLQGVRSTLGHLGVNEYIARDHQPILGRAGNGSDTNNLDEHRIKVRLELLGYNYIAEKIRLAKQDDILEKQTAISEKSGASVINTNEFTKKNAKKNLIILILTLLVAVAGTFATIKGCQVNTQEQKRLRLKEQKDSSIQQLQKELSKKDDILLVQKNRIDSLFHAISDTSKKSTPFNSDTIKNKKPTVNQ